MSRPRWDESPSAAGTGRESRDRDTDGTPFVFSVDQSWAMRSHGGQRGGAYHRTRPADTDGYGTAACSRRIILNTEDRLRADSPLAIPALCRRCNRGGSR